MPPWPGVFSAVGCILAGVRYDDTWSVLRRVERLSRSEISGLFERMAGRIFAVLDEEGVDRASVRLHHEAALQYEGQTHRLLVLLPGPDIEPADLARMFVEAYRRTYNVDVGDLPVRVVNLRIRAVVETEQPLQLTIPVVASGTIEDAQTGTTRMRFDGTWQEAPVYDRWAIPRGTKLVGPARVDQSDTTTIVPPGWSGSIDAMGNLELIHEGRP